MSMLLDVDTRCDQEPRALEVIASGRPMQCVLTVSVRRIDIIEQNAIKHRRLFQAIE
jgi:hypothetical protein